MIVEPQKKSKRKIFLLMNIIITWILFWEIWQTFPLKIIRLVDVVWGVIWSVIPFFFDYPIHLITVNVGGMDEVEMEEAMKPFIKIGLKKTGVAIIAGEGDRNRYEIYYYNDGLDLSPEVIRYSVGDNMKERMQKHKKMLVKLNKVSEDCDELFSECNKGICKIEYDSKFSHHYCTCLEVNKTEKKYDDIWKEIKKVKPIEIKLQIEKKLLRKDIRKIIRCEPCLYEQCKLEWNK